MDLQWLDGSSESRFAGYVERLAMALGHADRETPFRAYCVGLMLPGERKSVEPLAARVEPGRVRAAHQSLHHFVAKAAWDDGAVLDAVREMVLPAMLERGPLRAWIIDDTGMPKKGRHSVGVTRQYCGQIGKQDNCQVAVCLSVATEHPSLPVAFRLYLPQAWAEAPERRAKAGVPDDIAFQTKPGIALGQIRAAVAAGLPPAVVLMDAGYGTDTELRQGVSDLGLTYVAGIQSSLAARAGHPSSCAVVLDMNRCPRKPWPRDCRHRHGAPSRGAREPMLRSPPASPPRVSGRPIAMTSAMPSDRRSGCWSSGPRANRSRRSTGCRPYRTPWHSKPWSISPNAAGGSNAIISNSSRNSGSA